MNFSHSFDDDDDDSTHTHTQNHEHVFFSSSLLPNLTKSKALQEIQEALCKPVRLKTNQIST